MVLLDVVSICNIVVYRFGFAGLRVATFGGRSPIVGLFVVFVGSVLVSSVWWTMSSLVAAVWGAGRGLWVSFVGLLISSVLVLSSAPLSSLHGFWGVFLQGCPGVGCVEVGWSGCIMVDHCRCYR